MNKFEVSACFWKERRQEDFWETKSIIVNLGANALENCYVKVNDFQRSFKQSVELVFDIQIDLKVLGKAWSP